MTQKALKLFQLFLEIYVVYAILKMQLFIALICLFAILAIGRYEKTAFAETTDENDQTQEDADMGRPVPS